MLHLKFTNFLYRAGLRKNIIQQATPLFPIGIPRSGTTFLAKLLNSHHKVLMTNETAVFILLNEIINKSKIGIKAGILYGKQYHKLWSDHLAGNAKGIIESFYEKIYQENNVRKLKYWGDKHPHHNVCLDFIKNLYPHALYIYIVRDPRDVACSISEMNDVPFLKAFNTWRLFAEKYEAFVSNLINNQVYYMRYEDLVADYEKSTQEMLAWLNLDFSIEVKVFLDQYKHVDAHTYNFPKTVAQQKISENFSMKSIGRWKRDLSSSEQQSMSEEAEEYLHRHNYEIVAF